MIDTILTTLFILLLVSYSYFLIKIYRGLKKLKPPEIKTVNEFVSVIIPFRNESGKILNSLCSIESQDYPKDKFEVIYVNDSSSDDSFDKIIKANKSSNIKIVSVPEDFSLNAHKKRAVRFGIEKSSGEIIVTTDADCLHTKEWLKTLLSCFDENTGFVSGPVEFKGDGSIFSKFQRLEFAGLIIAGAGLIGRGEPVICNAANAAYRRKIYQSVNGFNDHLAVSSGDDELLMQKISRDTKYKIKFCLSKKAVAATEPNSSFNEFYHQRKRWASKGLFYQDKFLILKLILIFLFYLGLPVQLILAIVLSKLYFILFLESIAIKLILEYLVLNKGIKLLFEREILKPFFFAELFHIPYIIIAGISGVFGNFIWKDRKLKR
jgi:cellulose synthase/poly-beta-1,6-N-acetylglucosamine synthase-like glycosyltransferase